MPVRYVCIVKPFSTSSHISRIPQFSYDIPIFKWHFLFFLLLEPSCRSTAALQSLWQWKVNNPAPAYWYINIHNIYCSFLFLFCCLLSTWSVRKSFHVQCNHFNRFLKRQTRTKIKKTETFYWALSNWWNNPNRTKWKNNNVNSENRFENQNHL